MPTDYFRVKFCYDQPVSKDLVDDPRITAMGLFAEAYTGLTGRLAGQIAEHGLALIEFEVLIRLSRSPEGQLRMTDLSTQTSLTTSGVTRVVDRLERDGLVRRTACPSDRRSSYTVITRTGRERLASILPGHLDLIDQWFTGLLAPGQLTSLLAGLRVIRDAVVPGATAGANTTAGANAAAGTAEGLGGAAHRTGAGAAR
jgi:MarR family transcriptional regulator, 2-MHQ and catechol-resistance regulon repressor